MDDDSHCSPKKDKNLNSDGSPDKKNPTSNEGGTPLLLNTMRKLKLAAMLAQAWPQMETRRIDIVRCLSKRSAMWTQASSSIQQTSPTNIGCTHLNMHDGRVDCTSGGSDGKFDAVLKQVQQEVQSD